METQDISKNLGNGDILIYQSEDGRTHIDVRMEQETVWLTQQQMAELFQTSRTNVVEHIQHIYEEGELYSPQERDDNCLCVICHLFGKLCDIQSK